MTSLWRSLAIALGTVSLVGACTHGHGSSSASSSSTQSTSVRIAESSLSDEAIIAVHIGLFGGPVRTDGKMALSNTPQADATVHAVGTNGRTWRSRTGRDGVATLVVPAGHYVISSSFCGVPQNVVVTAGERARVQISCPVP